MKKIKPFLYIAFILAFAYFFYDTYYKDHAPPAYSRIADKGLDKVFLKGVTYGKHGAHDTTITFLEPFESSGVILKRHEFTSGDIFTQLAPLNFTIGTEEFTQLTAVAESFMQNINIIHDTIFISPTTSRRELILAHRNKTFDQKYGSPFYGKILDISVIPSNEAVASTLNNPLNIYSKNIHLQGQLVKIEIPSLHSTYTSLKPNPEKTTPNTNLILWVESVEVRQ